MQAYTGNFETNYLHIELEPVPLNHVIFLMSSLLSKPHTEILITRN